MKKVALHTDGACSGNPGRGGYGLILVWNGKEKELGGGFHLTTNNRMELLAVTVGLECLKETCEVGVFSDSRYLVDAMTKGWLENWQRRGWRTSGKKAVKNIDLWQRMTRALGDHRISWHWVRGHSGDAMNERADALAVYHRDDVARHVEDEGYTQESVKEHLDFT